MYVYIQSEKCEIRGRAHYLYTVGFYDPSGEWCPESDHENSEDAAKRVAYLNGNSNITEV